MLSNHDAYVIRKLNGQYRLKKGTMYFNTRQQVMMFESKTDMKNILNKPRMPAANKMN